MYKVAVIGATGNVGSEVLNILSERNFPISEIIAIASPQSIGKEVSFGDVRILKIKSLDNYDFSGTDFAFFCAGSKISEEFVPKAASKKCIAIDKSSYFRMKKNVPLIVPEVNLNILNNHNNIIASPNCNTIPIAVALSPLHDNFGIKRVIISTYQSVSGAGKAAMDELYSQTKSTYLYQEIAPKIFPKQIAFNIIPHIDDFMSDGYTKEEYKLINELGKIIDSNIKFSATCVRVPVFVGHSASVNVELEDDVSLQDIKKVLSCAKGIKIVDKHQDGGYITPKDSVQEDDVFISRIRLDTSLKNSFNMWVVADNLRKGAALNSVQIAEGLISNILH